MFDHAEQPAVLPTDRRALLAGIGGLAAGAILAGKANAGPLTPPPGPIAPTPGPEPRIAVNATNTPGTATALFRITQPGSYYLTGNITGVAGRHGIEIAASGVTLDLNGFDLDGAAGKGDFDGIRTPMKAITNIAILNGSVRNWSGQGVDLGSFLTCNSRIDGLRTGGNDGVGILLGIGSTVTNSLASGNGSDGISVGALCMVANCLANENGGRGINTSTSSSVRECVANQNDFDGFFIGDGCTLVHCTANINNASGFDILTNCTITNCSAFSNDIGIKTGANCIVEHCQTNFNGRGGFEAGTGSTVRACNAASQASNGQFGIRATGPDVKVLDNTLASCNIGIDFRRVNGCVAFRNICHSCPTGVAVNVGGNWYPFVDFSNINNVTNPLANLFT